MLFDQEELEVWLKQGRVVAENQPTPQSVMPEILPEKDPGIVDISASRVYHRNALYR